MDKLNDLVAFFSCLAMQELYMARQDMHDPCLKKDSCALLVLTKQPNHHVGGSRVQVE